MRVTTAFKCLMDLPGVTVSEVDFQPAKVVVTVKLRCTRLACPECGFTTRARYDTRDSEGSRRAKPRVRVPEAHQGGCKLRKIPTMGWIPDDLVSFRGEPRGRPRSNHRYKPLCGVQAQDFGAAWWGRSRGGPCPAMWVARVLQ